MREQNFLLRRLKLKVLFLAATATLMSFPVAAQERTITLPTKQLTGKEVFEGIHNQTDYLIAADGSRIYGLTVKITRSPLAVEDALDALLKGSGMDYQIDGNYIIVFEKAAVQKQSAVAVNITRNVAGTVVNSDGNTQEGVSVEIIGTRAKTTTTANGRFSIAGIPAGNHVVRLATAGEEKICYREIAVPSGGDAEVRLVFDEELMRMAGSATVGNTFAPAVKSTAYFIPKAQDNTIKAFSDEAKTGYTFIPTPQRQKYLPQVAVKTNLLWWATSTPNVAVEFALAPKWTLDIATGLNPWDLNDRKGGIRHGLIQPEVRYWFCNRFERHFLGLHGIYGQYQAADIKTPFFDITGTRYDGWGAGAGISYGYYLPMGGRWAWEFTVGVGYVYLDYRRYDCNECQTFRGRYNEHYFGPTKAGVSLIFMIR